MTIRRGTHIIHTVRPGDSVYYLAQRYESEIDAIVEANGLYPPFNELYMLEPGQVLVIPKTIATEIENYYVVQYGDTIGQLANRFNVEPELLSGINRTIHNPDYLDANQQILLPSFIYEVERGDTLANISQRTGVPIETILRSNLNRPAISEDVIYEGIQIIIPLPNSENIVVLLPLPGTEIHDGATLEGFARTFEGNVLYRLVDANNTIVTEEAFTTTRYGAPSYSPFLDQIEFDREPTSPLGELQVYSRSAQDGSIQDLVQVRVWFNY
ncbi:LysM repeat protein [Alkalibacillus filiformis]|uniref:LysM repeat protein n=1 Tax=Alkalibacillus filiformis TaxID=200990 RepID=A0ABU0DU15_9BACI|nr:LysM peptidoglycan-binding domain-containing protein [Alkalibacillus filiformis]MDQ0351949.1 LysM repeat protein [Alkalibacillus filiformis]